MIRRVATAILLNALGVVFAIAAIAAITISPMAAVLQLIAAALAFPSISRYLENTTNIPLRPRIRTLIIIGSFVAASITLSAGHHNPVITSSTPPRATDSADSINATMMIWLLSVPILGASLIGLFIRRLRLKAALAFLLALAVFVSSGVIVTGKMNREAQGLGFDDARDRNQAKAAGFDDPVAWKKERTARLARTQAEERQKAAWAAQLKRDEDAEAERRRQNAVDRQQQALGLSWQYSSSQDSISGGVVKQAVIRSSNTVEFGFPYQGAQRAVLTVRKHPRWGTDVIIQIERGQFACSIVDSCAVNVRFNDDGQFYTFQVADPESRDSTQRFVRDSNAFITSLGRSTHVRIEASFFNEGNRVFEFGTTGFQDAALN